MELVKDEKNKKIFIENNKIYQMLNMGSYVGHKNRSWYASKPAVWILMTLDEKCNDGEILHIEALVDDRGNYIRFIMKKGDIKRILQLEKGKVYSDTINDSRTCLDSLGLGETYAAMDGDIYSDEKVPLDEYLHCEQEFSQNGNFFQGDIPSNSSLEKFLIANEKLRTTLKTSSKR